MEKIMIKKLLVIILLSASIINLQANFGKSFGGSLLGSALGTTMVNARNNNSDDDCSFEKKELQEIKDRHKQLKDRNKKLRALKRKVDKK